MTVDSRLKKMKQSDQKRIGGLARRLKKCQMDYLTSNGGRMGDTTPRFWVGLAIKLDPIKVDPKRYIEFQNRRLPRDVPLTQFSTAAAIKAYRLETDPNKAFIRAVNNVGFELAAIQMDLREGLPMAEVLTNNSMRVSSLTIYSVATWYGLEKIARDHERDALLFLDWNPEYAAITCFEPCVAKLRSLPRLVLGP